MVGASRTRITISPKKNVLAKIDEYAEKMGMSRSDVVCFMVMQGIESYETVKNLPADVMMKLAESIGGTK